jgi:hypothetical protein
MATVITIINNDCTVIVIVIYNCKTFKVQATGNGHLIQMQQYLLNGHQYECHLKQIIRLSKYFKIIFPIFFQNWDNRKRNDTYQMIATVNAA